MSSDFHPPSISRNLVRISGQGYRENIDLQQSIRDAQASELPTSGFPVDATGTSVRLSRRGLSHIGSGASESKLARLQLSGLCDINSMTRRYPGIHAASALVSFPTKSNEIPGE